MGERGTQQPLLSLLLGGGFFVAPARFFSLAVESSLFDYRRLCFFLYATIIAAWGCFSFSPTSGLPRSVLPAGTHDLCKKKLLKHAALVCAYASHFRRGVGACCDAVCANERRGATRKQHSLQLPPNVRPVVLCSSARAGASPASDVSDDRKAGAPRI